MSCPEELDLFLLREGGGELSEEREREVAEHLASCPDCQAKMAELQGVADALARPDPLTDGQRAAFVADVVKAIDAKEEKTAPAAGLSRFWSVTVPITAAVCCGVMAVVVMPMFFVLGTRGSDEAVAVQSAARPPSAEPVFATTVEEAEEAEAPVMDEASQNQAAPAPPPSAARGRAFELAPNATGSGGATPSHAARPSGRLQAAKRSRGAPMRSPAAPAEGDLGRGGSADDAPAAREAERRQRLREQVRERVRRGNLGALQGQPGSPTKSLSQGWVPPEAGMIGSNSTGDRSVEDVLRGGRYGGIASRRPMATAAAQPTAIDPNGRFATTYRPGRGHLARFEKTMLQGQVPAPALALVAEVGRGRGPAIDPPTERALALDLRSGLGQLPPEGGPVHVAITLRSTTQNPTSRPAIGVHLVMDTSGSMSGAAINDARMAAQQLVSLLQPQDRFSLISYNTGATVVIPDGPVGSRRPTIIGQINSLQAGGGTNLEAGLREGYEQARQSRSREDSVQLVIVLSDGQPNQGVTDPWQLSEHSAAAFQTGIETTTIGVGDRYEPQVMSTIAEYGAGGYYYLPDASTIEQVLRAELDVRTNPVARGVELRVRLGDGVELLEAYGSRRLNEAEAQRVRATEVAIDHQAAHRDGITRDRQDDREGGMRFFIPGFARDDQHTILLRLRAPAGSSELNLADVELRYKDRITNSNQGDERQLRLTYAGNRQAAISTSDADVRRAVYAFRTGHALTQVSGMLTVGDQDNALALLYERVEMLRRAAEELDDATLRADAERLDSFREVVAQRRIHNNLMLGSMLQRAGTGFMR